MFFVGETTGASAITSNNCTLLGDQTNVGSDPLTFATAIGAGAVVNSSSMVQLGRANSDDTTIGRSLFQLTTGAATASLCNGPSVAGTQNVNICSGATPGAIQTVNVLNTTASTGAQTLNIATSATNTSNINIGSASGTGLMTIAMPTTFGKGIVYGNKATNVTQITSATTAVTSNAVAGQLTTVSETVAAGANVAFTLNNSFLTSTSQLYTQLVSYSGTGVPQIGVSGFGAGVCTITIFNYGAAAALSAALVFNFLVV